MRDHLWWECGNRPTEQGEGSRAPRQGLIALYCLAVSAALADAALLLVFLLLAFDDSPLLISAARHSTVFGILWCVSIALYAVGVASAILGLRGVDSRLFWLLLIVCWLTGPLAIPLILRIPRLNKPHPDGLRAVYGLVLSTQVGAMHAVALILVFSPG